MTIPQLVSSFVPCDRTRPEIRLALLGLGRVGSAVAALVHEPFAGRPVPMRIITALVRTERRGPSHASTPSTTDPSAIFDGDPDVIVEALGGLEPARTLVLEAIRRGIPVVTANKSLLAHHGGELLDAAARAGVPLRYEASVIAGVPFLGMFARRPYASRIHSLCGLVNGTTNYIVSELDVRGGDYLDVLAEAQRRGLAEPDPTKDVDGIDAAEKLCVLLRQFAARAVRPEQIATTGISRLHAADLVQARELGGTIKPVVAAQWSEASVTAFAGPAFLPSNHALARLQGAANGLSLRDVEGHRLCFTGPGAGPRATAVTVLDDVVESLYETPAPALTVRPASSAAPETGWFVRLGGAAATIGARERDALLEREGVGVTRSTDRRTCRGLDAQWFVTRPIEQSRLDLALRALPHAHTGPILSVRTLDADV
jgi:homoserine dehydrogenase